MDSLLDGVVEWYRHTSLVAAALQTTLCGFVILVATILYKLLRKPSEVNSAKLHFNTLPKPRWLRPTWPEQTVAKRKVLLLTYGTRGDVQPLVALAQALKHTLRYEAYISTAEQFQNFVESHGIKWVPCGIARVEQPSFIFDHKEASSFAGILSVFAEIYPNLAKGMWDAAVQIQPDIIMSQAVVRGIGAQCAEKLGVPHFLVHFAPSNTPTFSFPPSEYKFSQFGIVNKLKYTHRNIQIAMAAIKTGLSKSDEAFRQNILGLPAPLDPLVLISDIEREPAIHAYSSLLQPKPDDWADWNLVVGAFHLSNEDESKSVLPENLVSFVKAKQSKPVYIGFGSMEGAERQFELTVKCIVGDLGMRAILCTNLRLEDIKTMAGLVDLSADDICIIKAAPHTLLFPQCSVIVHHGGAGTTNAALQAGVPQIIIPILAWSDQPFWANVVERNGIGFRCSVDDLGHLSRSVQSCVKNKGVQTKAIAMQHAQHPNGCSNVISILDRLFETSRDL